MVVAVTMIQRDHPCQFDLLVTSSSDSCIFVVDLIVVVSVMSCEIKYQGEMLACKCKALKHAET